jgi:hypothetical protein
VNRCIAIIALLFGCDPAISSDYMGEPIASLRGTITSDFSEAPPEAEVILAWVNWRSDPGTVVGTRVPVEGDFPAGFTLTLHLPPPYVALNVLPEDRYAGLDEPMLGVAWILVLRKGAVPPYQNVLQHADIKAVQPGDVLGWAEDHVFVWVDSDVPEGSWAEEILSGTPPSGFHLMRAVGRGGADLEEIRACKATGRLSSTCTPMIDPLVPETPDTEVPVRLTPALETLRLPVFALPDAVEQAFGLDGGT